MDAKEEKKYNKEINHGYVGQSQKMIGLGIEENEELRLKEN